VQNNQTHVGNVYTHRHPLFFFFIHLPATLLLLRRRNLDEVIDTHNGDGCLCCKLERLHLGHRWLHNTCCEVVDDLQRREKEKKGMRTGKVMLHIKKKYIFTHVCSKMLSEKIERHQYNLSMIGLFQGVVVTVAGPALESVA
jgi:hypothetical protein